MSTSAYSSSAGGSGGRLNAKRWHDVLTVISWGTMIPAGCRPRHRQNHLQVVVLGVSYVYGIFVGVCIVVYLVVAPRFIKSKYY
ncbi:hypothetical protein GUJ93_ZPchr0009g1063 [Zizania palustris]|uniref:Uncharacterized protein n=1 Tax=Zizania palustris TaxID=103762 RepID=A0A8J5S1Y8_ZIZPA|nr:hypothetical protein GUJ93_ZPchr0009g1063 [Zizania palustris]